MSAVAHIKRYKSGEFFRDNFRGDLSWNGSERKVLLRNEGIGVNGVPTFSDVGIATGCDDIKDGRGLAIGDFNNDGALDLAISNNPGDCGSPTAPATVLRNNTGASRNWLAVELTGTTCNHDAIGAEVIAELSDTPNAPKLLRLVSAGASYASQHSARQYFGLGSAETVKRLTIRWPGGGEQTFHNVAAKQLVRITQGKQLQVGPLPSKVLQARRE